ncbi:hypothetical protein [Streptomyces sp. YIM 130001]|uniref:hypothetical protein n=1 Tax=Streptomyces sp. YIM 130001 TaxID=2259644 RepID=UPI0013C40330|nr:hypothetical protein [Streptomyces sp. YIM 130001]
MPTIVLGTSGMIACTDIQGRTTRNTEDSMSSKRRRKKKARRKNNANHGSRPQS